MDIGTKHEPIVVDTSERDWTPLIDQVLRNGGKVVFSGWVAVGKYTAIVHLPHDDDRAAVVEGAVRSWLDET